MTKQEEIELMRNDPEILAGIRQGMHDFHLGHFFSSKQVFGSLKGTCGRFYSRWYYSSIVKLKEFWWWLKIPYQNIKHRNCIHCKEFKEWQLEKRYGKG